MNFTEPRGEKEDGVKRKAGKTISDKSSNNNNKDRKVTCGGARKQSVNLSYHIKLEAIRYREYL
jgi:hypothetical protein